jgi:3-phenylpropionate/cinnamic acid dioxygenase small subunit
MIMVLNNNFDEWVDCLRIDIRFSIQTIDGASHATTQMFQRVQH